MSNAVAIREAQPDVEAAAAAELRVIQALHSSPELQQGRFTELHRRVWNSEAAIERFTEQGKTHAETNERRFLDSYRFEIDGLTKIAAREDRELQAPDRDAPTTRQAGRVALISEDAPNLVADFIRPDGRRQRSYLIKGRNSTTMY